MVLKFVGSHIETQSIPSRPMSLQTVKGEGKRFLHGDLICTYTLPEYTSSIYVDDLCIINVKLNFETGRDFVSHYLFTAK